MKKLMMILTLAALSGCASLNYAGNADYSVKPFVAQDGTIQCCEVRVHNGKEIGLLDATIDVKKDGSYKVHLMEKSVLAFKGQEISADVAKTGIRAGAAAAASVVNPAAALVPK